MAREDTAELTGVNGTKVIHLARKCRVIKKIKIDWFCECIRVKRMPERQIYELYAALVTRAPTPLAQGVSPCPGDGNSAIT